MQLSFFTRSVVLAGATASVLAFPFVQGDLQIQNLQSPSTATGQSTALGPSSNATINSNSTSSSLGEDVEIICFSPFPGVQLFPARGADCAQAVEDIVGADKAMGTFTWTRRPGVGYLVPHVWPATRTCRFSIAPEPDDAEDDFQPALVGHVAAEIVEQCVIGALVPLGGSALMGPKKVMRLNVLGVKYPSNDANQTAIS